MHQLSEHKKSWIIVLCLYGALILAHAAAPLVWAEQTKEEKERQRMLNLEAANALWRLKQALEKEGFYAGRVRLNVWRAAAMDAGKFDPQKYEEFKQQLYQKSVKDALKCFEFYIEQNSPHDAKMCLQTWKVHASEIGQFDEEIYNKLIQRLDSLKDTSE
jgi:Na+-transporting NADH:ubiquinone oxidoreductase subunit NqrC